jgi:hypothetical protein
MARRTDGEGFVERPRRRKTPTLTPRDPCHCHMTGRLHDRAQTRNDAAKNTTPVLIETVSLAVRVLLYYFEPDWNQTTVQDVLSAKALRPKE